MAKGKQACAAGTRQPQMLAEHLELSQTTVSLVLNNSPSAKSIPQETRNRVIEAAGGSTTGPTTLPVRCAKAAP